MLRSPYGLLRRAVTVPSNAQDLNVRPQSESLHSARQVRNTSIVRVASVIVDTKTFNVVLCRQLQRAQSETEKLAAAAENYKRDLLRQRAADAEHEVAALKDRLKESVSDSESAPPPRPLMLPQESQSPWQSACDQQQMCAVRTTIMRGPASPSGLWCHAVDCGTVADSSCTALP